MELLLLCLLSAAGGSLSQRTQAYHRSTCGGGSRCLKSSECGSTAATRGDCGEAEDGVPLVCCPQGACPPPIGTKATIKCLEWVGLLDRKDLETQVAVSGGRNAIPKEYPHMAEVGFGDGEEISWRCGGSLISEYFVLSAAHCSYLGSGRTNPARWVRVGELDQDSEDDDAMPEIVQIQRIYNHPRYNSTNYRNDLSLYRLATRPRFNDYVRPACIHTQHKLMEGDHSVIGYGLLQQAGVASSVLQTALVSTFKSSYACDTIFPDYRDNIMVCANPLTTQSACKGDSGGPLNHVLKYPKSPVYSVVGVTSFGRSCGRYAGAYTRVSYYVDWIEDIVWPDHVVLTRSA